MTGDTPATAADSLRRSVDQLSLGTGTLVDAVARLSDTQIEGPSALPGWSRATLLTHLARNADALGNLLTWARTGIETPMYADPSSRAAAIDAGALRAPQVIRDDLTASNDRLIAGIAALGWDRWSYLIRTAQGRELPVSVVPWLRSREVWVHAIDLDAGVTFDSLPAEFVVALVADSLELFATRPQCPPVLVQPIDGPAPTRIGGEGDPAVVSGSARDLLPWVLGRPDVGSSRLTSSIGDLPALPPWL
jgi:maleylpyruvate isomerase